MWTDRRLLELLDIEVPILQAPMAGACGPDMAVAVSEAGGLGALPAAVLTPEVLAEQVADVQARTGRPFNVNFFCHAYAEPDPARTAGWMERLAGYYRELGLGDEAPTINFPPFGQAMCAVIEEARPAVVSFHYGLPDEALLGRVKAAGCKVISSATTVAEAQALAERGCDAVIAQGAEAGGHRGMFLSGDLIGDVATQAGTLALVPQVADAVRVPVIAAGGIADGRGIAAAFALGAAGVQIGTAYLFTPEATIGALYRAALERAGERGTALTNVLTGRPARSIVNRVIREVGPISEAAPAFPMAMGGLAPLKAKAEASGADDFSAAWAGQAAPLGRAMGAGALTRRLAEEGLARMAALSVR